MPKVWKGAILVCGEPGTGKSRWIREEAAAAKARLFRWNVRTDRSLREGREILHQQVRSKEQMFVWIEGADDLTQEAQAFLRRILETAAPSVTCVLEVRELWKMSPPVLSRCTIVTMRSDISIRAQTIFQKAVHLGLVTAKFQSDNETQKIGTTISWKDIPALRKEGMDPYTLLNIAVQNKSSAPLKTVNKDAIETYRAVGAGSSPWIQLTNYLVSQEA